MPYTTLQGSSPGKRVRAAKAKAPQGHNTGDGSDSEDMEEEEEEEEDYEERSHVVPSPRMASGHCCLGWHAS